MSILNPKLYSEIITDVEMEFEYATQHFGSFRNGHEGYAVIQEKLDELWTDVKNTDLHGALNEARQVATMAIRFIHDLSDNT